MTLSRQQRVLVAIGAAGGACAIAIPAALALSHNPTFGQRIIPVHAPSSAHVVRFDDHGGVVEAAHHPRQHRDDPTPRKHGDPITSTVASSREPEPGDDRTTPAPSSSEPEPGDDHGGNRGPGGGGDDHGRGDDGGHHHGGDH